MTERRPKYNARKTEVDGYVFASHAEARRYSELKLLEEAVGIINGLELQPKFALIVNGEKIGTYVADFAYTDLALQKRIIEDVKGFKTPVYRLKKKLVEALYGIEIVEVS